VLIAMGVCFVLPARVLAHGGAVPAPSFPAVLLEWRFEPVVLVAVAITAQQAKQKIAPTPAAAVAQTK